MSLFDKYGPDEPLIMSGAGLLKTFDAESIRPYAATVNYAVVGSITLNSRAGNTGRQEFISDQYSLNSWGMPNPGSTTHLEKAPFDNLIVSIAEFSPERYAEAFRRLHDKFAGVELNFGCPNTESRIFSFSPYDIGQTLERISQIAPDVTIGIKVSPYSDRSTMQTVAKVIRESGIVDYVATVNTYPGGLAFNYDGTNVLDTAEQGYFGGIGGEALKPISLSEAVAWHNLLPDIDIIRVGGISSGWDVYFSYLAGCKGVQVVTAARNSPLRLERIREEYAQIYFKKEGNIG